MATTVLLSSLPLIVACADDSRASLDADLRGALRGEDVTACGEFDVGADWDQAQRDPVRRGVRCLVDAFGDGDPATLTFAYEADPGDFIWEYEVVGRERLIVTSRRNGPTVSPEMRLVREECSALDVDNGGAPVALGCSRTGRAT